MARLFVALEIPPAAAAALEQTVAALRDQPLRWVTPQRWHLTIEFLGDADVDQTASIWRQRAHEAAPMRLHLAGAGAFPNVHHGTVLWIGTAGDSDAWRRIAGDDQQPHLTIARSRRPANMTAAVNALAAYEGPEWTATEVVLFDSQPGKADDGGHRLQRQGDAVLPAPQAQARQLNLSLLVQVLLLQPDQIGLLVEEGGRLGVEVLAALRCPAERQGDSGGIGLIEHLLGRGFGLFAMFSHAAAQPRQRW